MKVLLPDELWATIEPLLPGPKRRRFRHPGRKPLDRRKVLTGILFVLRTGIRWNDLPAELGCGSGSRCRRYLAAWHRAGVWNRLHAVLLAQLDGAGKIDWSRGAVDSSTVRALGGGTGTGPNPTDRGRPGSKHHAVVDPHGIPLAAVTTAANVPDVVALPQVADAIPAMPAKARGRRKRRPRRWYGDRAYDSDPHRRRMRRRNVEPVFARRRTAHGSGLGKYRWPVERFFAWLHGYRRLRLRTDSDVTIHNAFLKLALGCICFGFL
ncbi:MAG TPA: IS5 family transposase [Gemmata sp.]